jgi:hypothetical protein
MIGNYLQHLASPRKGALVLTVVSLLALILAPSAFAEKDFAVFAQCPTKAPEVRLCFYAETTSGEIAIRSTKVPISAPIIFQGGATLNEEAGTETFVGATNGETLSKAPQRVPGGLLGVVAPESLPKFLQEIINKLVSEGLDEVTATAELVGNPGISRTNLLFQEGVALSLPVRIHLSNTFLGSACYIGSKASPATFQLTTGTTNPPKPNKPISGAVGKLEFRDEFQIAKITENKLVDNAFSVPTASGCGGLLSLLINPAVNLKLGLPSESGHNTAILEGTLENATAESVVNNP